MNVLDAWSYLLHNKHLLGIASAHLAAEVVAERHGDEQPAQNWSGQGESDCLIKMLFLDLLLLLLLSLRGCLESEDRVLLQHETMKP